MDMIRNIPFFTRPFKPVQFRSALKENRNITILKWACYGLAAFILYRDMTFFVTNQLCYSLCYQICFNPCRIRSVVSFRRDEEFNCSLVCSASF